MSLEVSRLDPKTPRFSVQDSDLQEEWERASAAGENPEKAVAVLRRKLEGKVEKANNVVQMKNTKTEHAQAIKETQEGIQDLSKLSDEERQAIMREFEGKKGSQ